MVGGGAMVVKMVTPITTITTTTVTTTITETAPITMNTGGHRGDNRGRDPVRHHHDDRGVTLSRPTVGGGSFYLAAS